MQCAYLLMKGEKILVFKKLLRPERSEGLHFFNEALDRGYAQFEWASRNLLISLPDLDETGLK